MEGVTMTGKTKLLIAFLVAIGSISVVTVLANTIYFPVIVKSPTVTPTATFTATPTVTRTPSITATPTKTPTPTPGVFIADIVYDPTNPLDEYIEIENTGNNSVDMDNWWIKVDWLEQAALAAQQKQRHDDPERHRRSTQRSREVS